MTAHVVHGDATALPLAPLSVDAVVCDPPYGLEFMGKDWDAPWKSGDGFRRSRNPADAERNSPFGRSSRTSPEYIAGVGFQRWSEQWAAEAFRVLKPGGYLLAFGGSRTWHRLACAIEDAGFELRDSIAWMYGSGFPKSLDVSKAIDKAAGADREVIGSPDPRKPNRQIGDAKVSQLSGGDLGAHPGITAPATDAARQWQGWGTSLKPAFEPIVVARKPLVGTVAQNVTMHGTGALNIAACRVAHGADVDLNHQQRQSAASAGMSALGESGFRSDHEQATYNPSGRWPSNVVLSHAATCLVGDCEPGCPVAELDQQSGKGRSRIGKPRGAGSGDGWGMTATGAEYADEGGASRFFPTFRYQAKAPVRERPSYYRFTCDCETIKPCLDTSPPRDIDASESTGVTSWNTSTSGSSITGEASRPVTMSTTSTTTSSTTGSRTCDSSADLNTNGSTPDVNSGTESGGSPARSAANSSPSRPNTGTSAGRVGPSTGNAALATSLRLSETSKCESCGAPTKREAHPTTKPLDLMRWLVRLVTPPGGVVLDPFAGSGTTLEAAQLEGFAAIGVEKHAPYLPLIAQRLERSRIAPTVETDWVLDLFGDAA